MTSEGRSFPAVSDLSEAAAGSLLGVFSRLAELRQPRLAGWAAAVSDALVARLVDVTIGIVGDDRLEPVPLVHLDAAELEGVHWVLSAAASDSYDRQVIGWLTQLGRLICAEFDRREQAQAQIDAQCAAIEAAEARRSNPPE